MTAFALLVVAGFGAGVVGTVAGLASLVSYPALLAAGLPPLSANVSNTTAMTAVGLGSIVALGSLLLLFRDTLRGWAVGHRGGHRRTFGLAIAGAGMYSGYFGAGAGIIVLALLTLRYADPFHVSNAMKTLITGVGNLVATALYVAVAPVSWSAVLPIAIGMLAGGVAGPRLARRLPERGLRIVIGLLGLGLAVWLAR